MKKRKNRIITGAILISGMLLLSGCTADEQVLFVSSTEASSTETYGMTETDYMSDEAQSVVFQESRKITVHVCGAVKKAGVFELEEGSRVMDVVLAAGGFSKEADEEYVNLAMILTDGDKVKIPTKEEAFELTNNGLKQSDNGVTNWKNPVNTQADTFDRVNINTADKEELCTLPGIGQTRAESILTYRKEHGEFSKIEDIMLVSGIKDSSFQKIKDRITVK